MALDLRTGPTTGRSCAWRASARAACDQRARAGPGSRQEPASQTPSSSGAKLTASAPCGAASVWAGAENFSAAGWIAHARTGAAARASAAAELFPQHRQGGERHQEFQRGGEPQPETQARRRCGEAPASAAPTAPANRVDCHRWSSSAAIMRLSSVWRPAPAAAFRRRPHPWASDCRPRSAGPSPAACGRRTWRGIHPPAGAWAASREITRLEDMGIADLAGPAQRLLGFQPVHHGLHRGVGGPVLGRRNFPGSRGWRRARCSTGPP